MDMRYCQICGSEYNAQVKWMNGKDGIGCVYCNPKSGKESYAKSFPKEAMIGEAIQWAYEQAGIPLNKEQ